MLPLDLALVHHPVLNKHDEVISSQLDTFDFFDLSRLSLSLPIGRLYIVNPLESQRAIFERLVAHSSADDRPAERWGFAKTQWRSSLEDLRDELGPDVRVLGTTAKSQLAGLNWVDEAEARSDLRAGQRTLLVFGKAWGLTPELLRSCDRVLRPIDYNTGYNHLSVRSAVAIVADRLVRDGR